MKVNGQPPAPPDTNSILSHDEISGCGEPTAEFKLRNGDTFESPLCVKQGKHWGNFFYADYEAVNELLPPYFYPVDFEGSGKALVQIYFVEYEQGGIGDYRELIFTVAVSPTENFEVDQVKLTEAHQLYQWWNESNPPEDHYIFMQRLWVSTKIAKDVGNQVYGTPKTGGTYLLDREWLPSEFTLLNHDGEQIITIKWDGQPWLPIPGGQETLSYMAYPNRGEPQRALADMGGRMWVDLNPSKATISFNEDTRWGRIFAGLGLEFHSTMRTPNYKLVLHKPEALPLPADATPDPERPIHPRSELERLVEEGDDIQAFRTRMFQPVEADTGSGD